VLDRIRIVTAGMDVTIIIAIIGIIGGTTANLKAPSSEWGLSS
jgi:hypothetical protein